MGNEVLMTEGSLGSCLVLTSCKHLTCGQINNSSADFCLMKNVLLSRILQTVDSELYREITDWSRCQTAQDTANGSQVV